MLAAVILDQVADFNAKHGIETPTGEVKGSVMEAKLAAMLAAGSAAGLALGWPQ